MTGTRSNVFRKRDNLAAWIIQLICSTILLILAILAIVRTSGRRRYVSIDGIIYTVISLLTIALDIAEVITFGTGYLNPVFLLVSAVIKTGIWAAFFILLICSFALWGFFYAPLNFVLLVLLFGSSLSQLVIGSIVVHRKRKGTLIPVGQAQVHKSGVGSV